MIAQTEMADVFSRFLDEQGMYFRFKKFLHDQGYSMSEFGMEEDGQHETDDD